MNIATVEQMREMDRAAVERFGIPELILMENAGNAAAAVLDAVVGIEGKRFVVFCGPGNNGGDGFVVARKILSSGGDARVVLLADRARISGISAANLDILLACGICVSEHGGTDAAGQILAQADALVDAILGTGLSKPVSGHYRETIAAINASGLPVLSLDIPSGVNGDTGQVMGEAVRADWTVTFGLPKLGNVLAPGCFLGGRLFVTHISFPPELTRSGSLKAAFNIPAPVPARNPAGHKGDFGDVLFVAGAATYFGAPYLSAMAFLKAGGGYSRLAAPESMIPHLAAKAPEVVFAPMRQTDSGSIALSNLDAILKISDGCDMVVVGPGVSLNSETRELVRRLARQIEKPLLVDGDGLTAVAQDPECIRCRRAETVLTPHPGEMARIAGCTVSDIAAGRVGILRKTAADLQATVVLKGARSLICGPEGRVFVNCTGNSGMATAGSGDVLCGTAAAMHTLGMPVAAAAAKGVFIHGLAGDLAAQALGEDGMTAEDILHYLPAALAEDRRGLDPARKVFCAGATSV